MNNTFPFVGNLIQKREVYPNFETKSLFKSKNIFKSTFQESLKNHDNF